MSILNQIPQPGVPFGQTDASGKMIINQLWYLFLYNVSLAVQSTKGQVPLSSYDVIDIVDLDAATTDPANYPKAIINALLLAEPLPQDATTTLGVQGNVQLANAITLVPGTAISFVQSGQSITVNATGGSIGTYLTPINNTGATSDLALGVGQSVFVDVSAATSALLHIATATDQVYEIMMNGVVVNTSSTTRLFPNNINYGSVYTYRNIYAANTTPVGVSASNTIYSNLTISGPAFASKTTLFTSINKKSWISSSASSTTTASYVGTIEIEWQDTTTVWSSLGTVDFGGVAWTGRIWIRRIG